MAEEKVNQLLDNMTQIERFFCDNCSNKKCTVSTMKECTIAFAILAKNTSWGFAMEEIRPESSEELEMAYNAILT